MPRAKATAKPLGTVIVRRSNRDRNKAIESAALAISRCGWASLDVVCDEQDDEGVWHYAIRVRTKEAAA